MAFKLNPSHFLPNAAVRHTNNMHSEHLNKPLSIVFYSNNFPSNSMQISTSSS